MITLLAIFSLLLLLVLVAVLVYFLIRIVKTLEAIGGSTPGYGSKASDLSKIRFGLRAIETQTSHLGPEVTRLNGMLASTAGGLQSIDGHLVGVIEHVSKQEG
jgi:hypothetical protein